MLTIVLRVMLYKGGIVLREKTLERSMSKLRDKEVIKRAPPKAPTQ